MRVLALGSLLLLALQHHVAVAEPSTSGGGGLYPPGLAAHITRANVLLSAGQFGEAAKVYSEAIEQSPTDYLLYYKRATAYFSMQKHGAALEDFDKVLSLTSNTFDNAHLMKAKIHLREGDFSSASSSLQSYLKAKRNVKDKEAEELEIEIKEGEKMKDKTEKERRAQLWNACVDSAGQALRIASHSPEIRTWRAECALGSGDVESSVADLSRLSHLLPPSTTLQSTIAKLTYFLTPPSAATMNALKQCLHFDPDSKICLRLHRLVKGLDRSFKQLGELLEKEDWKGVVRLLVTPGGGGKNGNLYERYEDALAANLGSAEEVLPLVPPSLLYPTSSSPTPSSSSSTPPSSSSSSFKSKKHTKPLPQPPLPPLSKSAPQRQLLVRSLCKSFIHLADIAKSSDEYKKQRKRWCEDLLSLNGCEGDVDGLVGRGESLVSEEEYEEGVRVLNEAFEKGGRGDAKVQQRLHHAHKLLKQSKQKDYYKIVGVSRDADERTIKKAYRKAAKAAHPDKGGSEAKMAALNEAYEVLSNPEFRARFDAGEDPMDPQTQAGGGNPFGGFGGFPGGGFQGGGGGHPFAQFFQGGGPGGGFGGQQGGGGGGHQWHFSHGF